MTKILLVEDSKFVRMGAQRALLRAGYEVSVAEDGQQALEMAKAETPDLILLDMLLPKISGPDVLKALKKDPVTEKIAVVAFSGLSQANAERLQHDGASAFVEKSSIDLDHGFNALLGALAQILRQHDIEVPTAPARKTAKAGSRV
jgi:CheY-like chemotaxis protein